MESVSGVEIGARACTSLECFKTPVRYLETSVFCLLLSFSTAISPLFSASSCPLVLLAMKPVLHDPSFRNRITTFFLFIDTFVLPTHRKVSSLPFPVKSVNIYNNHAQHLAPTHYRLKIPPLPLLTLGQNNEGTSVRSGRRWRPQSRAPA